MAKGILIAFFVLLGIIVLCIGYLAVVYTQLGKLSYENTAVSSSTPMVVTPAPTEVIPSDAPTFVPPTSTPEATATPTPMPELTQDVTNILVLGADTREPQVFDDARSDVNIILTIDKKNNEVKITSIMRDVLVYYPDINDYQRINYALRHYDDPQGVVDIIESNFGIQIDNYMITDFWGMAQLIDIFGGVEVIATDAEISNLNDILWNLNELYGYDDLRQDFYLGEPGEVLLTGRQAVAYMRVRKVGADYERVTRQYEVLDAIKNELSSMNFVEINKIINQLPQMLTTDMTQMELIKTAATLYKMRTCDMTNARVPFDGAYQPSTYKGMWILDIDFDENKKLLNEFIYE